jgi:hypothetical protein
LREGAVAQGLWDRLFFFKTANILIVYCNLIRRSFGENFCSNQMERSNTKDRGEGNI